MFLLREFAHAASHHTDRLSRGAEIGWIKLFHDTCVGLTKAEANSSTIDLSDFTHIRCERLRALAREARNAGDFRQARNAVHDIPTPAAQAFKAEMEKAIKHRTDARKARAERGREIAKAIRQRRGLFSDETPRHIIDDLASVAEHAGDLLQAYNALKKNHTGYAQMALPRLAAKLKSRYKTTPSAVPA